MYYHNTQDEQKAKALADYINKLRKPIRCSLRMNKIKLIYLNNSTNT